MALTQIQIKTSEVEKQRLGYIGVSLSEWNSANEPVLKEGSVIEVGSSLFEAQADQDIDAAGNWLGFANETLVYGYIHGTNFGIVLTDTSPAWSEEKQGWYDATEIHRYIFSIYKDGFGNYTQKTILSNREFGVTQGGINLSTSDNIDKNILISPTAYIKWNETNSQFSLSHKAKILIPTLHMQDQKAQNTAGGTATAGSREKRVLNTTITNTITGASLNEATSIFTLPAGTYSIKSKSLYFDVGLVKNWIYNNTAGVDIDALSLNINASITYDGSNFSEIPETIFTITETSTFQFDSEVSSTKATSGFGIATNLGVEVYADVIVKQLV